MRRDRHVQQHPKHRLYPRRLRQRAAADSSGHGQGQYDVGSYTAVTDGSGNAAFDFTLAAASSPNDFISLTATDPSGNTSEFSNTVAANIDPKVTIFGAPATANEGTPIALVSNVTAPNIGQVYTSGP